MSSPTAPSAIHSHQRPVCAACNAQLTHLESLQCRDLEYAVCASFECRRIMAQKSQMNVEIFRHQVDFHKQVLTERRRREAARKEHAEEVARRLSEDNAAALQTVLRERPWLEPAALHMANVPSGLNASAPLEQKRREAYTKHLEGIIGEACALASSTEVDQEDLLAPQRDLKDVEARFAANPGLRTVSERLCGICKGGCCAGGANHAYLSALTMRRIMDVHPDMHGEDILALYLSHLRPETIVHACINQTVTGCALPRTLRSDVCNSYYCGSLSAYHDHRAGLDGGGTVLAVQRAHTNWNLYEPGTSIDIVGLALVTETDVDPLAVPPTESPSGEAPAASSCGPESQGTSTGSDLL